MKTKETNILSLASPPITVDVDAPADEAARLMQRNHVGSVIAARDGRSVGIMTDRDLALRILTRPSGAPSPTVGSVMSEPLQTLPATASIADATRFFGTAGVRRAGVTAPDGTVVGVLTFDSVLLHLGGRVELVAGAIHREFREERVARTRDASFFGPE